jgi:hypothetical protein
MKTRLIVFIMVNRYENRCFIHVLYEYYISGCAACNDICIDK